MSIDRSNRRSLWFKLFVLVAIAGSFAFAMKGLAGLSVEEREREQAGIEQDSEEEFEMLSPGNRDRDRDRRKKVDPWSTETQTPGRTLITTTSKPQVEKRPAQTDTFRTNAIQTVVPGEYNGDVRNLPPVPSIQWEENETERGPRITKSLKPGSPEEADSLRAEPNIPLAAMPSPIQNFAGLSRGDAVTGGTAGAGTPPDTNGDVGMSHYIQSVNSSYAIYNKTGALQAAFTENSLWATAGTGTLCDTNHRGDPVVIYDQFADRWFLTDFAFSGTGNAVPFYQCFAVSKTNNPVSGGWWFYAVRVDDASHPWLNDYPKFGNWNDGCLYMSANEFTTAGAFAGTLFASFNKADMEAGLTLTGSNASVGYIVNTSDPFTMIPSNISGAKTAAYLPPAGTPNYFVSESQTAFAFEVRKFAPGAGCGTGGTLGAATNIPQTTYTVPGTSVPQSGTATKLDSLGDRMMQKTQYRRVGASESLWITHTYRVSSIGVTGSQWAQLDVTGGTVAAAALQQQKYDPADGLYRWMSSIAADKQGNVALGYSTSSATAFPGLAYSGRLSTDPANNLSQTETTLVAGIGSQTGNCGGSPCTRWGDYSSMSVDPADDCTFWFTSEYYNNNSAATIAWDTRIGSFKFPGCTASPTAADVSISGRVLTTNGMGLKNAIVLLTGAGGVTQQVRTGSMGYYRFANVAAGATYVLDVNSNRYTFASRLVTVSDDLTDVDMIAQ